VKKQIKSNKFTFANKKIIFIAIGTISLLAICLVSGYQKYRLESCNIPEETKNYPEYNTIASNDSFWAVRGQGNTICFIEKSSKKLVDGGLLNTALAYPIPAKRVEHFWFEKESKKFTIISSDEVNNKKNYFLTSYSLQDEFKKNSVSLPLDPNAQQALILDYFSKHKKFLVWTFSAKRNQSCSETAQVLLFTSNGKVELITPTSIEHANNNAPYKIGYNKGLLYFAQTGGRDTSDKITSDPCEKEYAIEKFYTLEPISRKKELIVISPRIPENIIDAYLDDKDPNILAMYDSSSNRFLKYKLLEQKFVD